MSSPNSFHEPGGAASSRKRLVLLLASVTFGGLVAALAFVVFSLWIEDRYPSGDPKRAISAVAQRANTKPIVDGVNRGVSAYLRKQIEIAYMYPSLSLEEILRRFSDARIDPAERRLFAYRLA